MQTEIKFDLKELLTPLEEQVKENRVNIRDFKAALKNLSGAKQKIQQMLYYVRGESNDLNSLYHDLAADNFSDLVDELNSLGRKKRSKLGKSFENMGFKLLEQTRAGKREDVMYGIMRIYISHGLEMDRQLLLAFKHPNTEMFKVLLYSFLSGAIKPKPKAE